MATRSCSCLENRRDGGAWWAAVYRVTQSRTRLKRLSRSSATWETPYLKLGTYKSRRKRLGRAPQTVVVGQSLSCVQLFATPWTAAHQASLPFTTSQSLLKLVSIESVISSNHLILCQPLLLLPQSFPTSESFPMSRLFTSDGQRIGVSASVSVLPMNIQG